MSSLLKIKINSKIRDIEEKRQIERKRSILLLIYEYLLNKGYINTISALRSESDIRAKQFLIADNIDLDIIFRGFEDYFLMKFGKRPIFYKDQKQSISTTNNRGSRTRGGKKNINMKNNNNGYNYHDLPHILKNKFSSSSMRGMNKERGGGGGGERKMKRKKSLNIIDEKKMKKNTSNINTTTMKKKKNHDEEEKEGGEIDGFITVSKIKHKEKGGKKKKKGNVQNMKKNVNENENENEKNENENGNGNGNEDEKENEATSYFQNRLMKPLPLYGFNSEYRELAESIKRDIIVNNPKVYWKDIVGLERAKKLVMEAVVLPMKYPDFFTGVLTPWRGILLFGPPGTGKTMLAKAVATECKTTFFNISASSIVSKWRGDSEKLIRCLFELARYYAPSTVFIDELDSILSQRRGNEHQASRRMKTELLIQMDGLSKTKDHIFILTASNLPWDLDSAVLRRLEKRILVGLPSQKARETILKKLLQDKQGKDLDFTELAKQTEKFSGADITSVCKEALMRPVRKIMKKLELYDPSKATNEDENISQEMIKVEMNDVEMAIKYTKPSMSINNEKYNKWENSYGANTELELDEEEEM